MKKNKAQKDILYIALSSFILVVAWISFNLYHAWTTTTISEDLQIQIEPIDPQFDVQVIQNLKTRNKIVPANQVKNSVGTVAEPSIIPEASESAQIKPTP